MAQRSDFQGAMLFFSATTFVASVLIGNEGLSIGEYIEIFSDMFARYLPGGVPDASDLSDLGGTGVEGTAPLPDFIPASITGLIPDSLRPYLDNGMALIMTIGWSISALGAAVWRRLQMFALGLLGLASGESIRETLMMSAESVGTFETSAMLLQGFSFTAASLGLMGLAKAKMFGRKKIESALQPNRF